MLQWLLLSKACIESAFVREPCFCREGAASSDAKGDKELALSIMP